MTAWCAYMRKRHKHLTAGAAALSRVTRLQAPAAEQAILDILSDRSSGASSSGDAADSRGGSSGSSDGSNGSSTLGVLLPGDVKVVYVKFDHCM